MNLKEVIMAKVKNQKIWVTIRVARGFPVEAKGYRKKVSAEKQELLWRKNINMDYDETGVLEVCIG